MTNERFTDYLLGNFFRPVFASGAIRLRADINELLGEVWEMRLSIADSLTARLIDTHLTHSYAEGDLTILTPEHLGALKSIQARTAKVNL